MRRLIELVAEATQHRDRDDLDAAIARLIADLIDPDKVTIYRVTFDGRNQRVERRVTIVRRGPTIGPDRVGPAALPCVRDVEAWNECALLRDAVHSQIENAEGREVQKSLYPIMAENELGGLLEIEFDAARPALRTRDARLIAAVLRIVRNHLALLDYGERDTLTGMLNRKTFEATFSKVRDRVRTASRNGDSELPSWLGVVDIDHFKLVNDRFGHLFGDEVLLLVSRLMRDCFRGADRMFRFGGEEFTIILDRTNEAGAATAFERLRAAIERTEFPQVGRVTVSLGFTVIGAEEAAASAFERADAALYFAKKNGRNQVQGYERLVATGLVQAKELEANIEMF